MGIRCADHMTPLYPQKLALSSPTGGGRSVGIVRSRTKATEFFFLINTEMCMSWLLLIPSGVILVNRYFKEIIIPYNSAHLKFCGFDRKVWH